MYFTQNYIDYEYDLLAWNQTIWGQNEKVMGENIYICRNQRLSSAVPSAGHLQQKGV